MKTIDRYIGTAVATSTLLVMFVLLSLFTFFTFADELSKTGRGDYGALQAARYALFTVPSMVYQLFPPAALLGTMLGLGILASGSELTVMRALGVSVGQIIRAVMKFGLIVMLLAFLIGEFIAPPAERYAATQRSLAMNKQLSLQTKTGLWIRDGASFINIKKIRAGGRLGETNIFEIDKKGQVKKITNAKGAIFQARNQWQLNELKTSTINSDHSLTLLDKASEIRPSLMSENLLSVVSVKPETMSAWTLYQYAGYLIDNGIDARKYTQAFWAKIASPLSTAIMVFLAIPFIFGPLRSVTAGHRILIGTMVGIGFHLVGQIFSYMGLVYEFNPIISAFVPSTIFLALAAILVRRVW